MLQGLRTVVYFVEDPQKAKTWYEKILGIAPYYDTPYYIGFNVGGYELGIHPLEGGIPGSETYWGVVNADEAYAKLLSEGCTSHTPISDVGDGIRLGVVMDPLGNELGIIENPHFKVSEVK